MTENKAIIMNARQIALFERTNKEQPELASIIEGLCYALEAQTPPEGMVLVPIEPTKEMIESGRLGCVSRFNSSWPYKHIYKAMIAAAQQPSKEG